MADGEYRRSGLGSETQRGKWVDLTGQADCATCIGYNEYAMAVVATTVFAIGCARRIGLFAVALLAGTGVAVTMV